MFSKLHKRLFEEWNYYDFDAIKNNWQAPQMMLSELDKVISFIPNDFSVADVGCGTGLSGKKLLEYGFEDMDGFDFSVNMLSKLREKSIGYKNLYESDITDANYFSGFSNRYDLVFSIGVLGDYAPVSSSLPNLCILGKNNSLLAFCGTDKNGIEDPDFISFILDRCGFDLISHRRMFAYKMRDRRKDYEYYIAKKR